MWGFQFNLLSRIMPRNFDCWTISSCSPSILAMMLCGCLFAEGPKIMMFVFLILRDSLLVLNHSVSKGNSELMDFSSSGSDFAEVMRLESSAKSMVSVFLKMVPRSLM